MSPPRTKDATDDDPEFRLAWLRLARSRNVGGATFRRLIARHGRPDRALEALPALAASAGARDFRPCPRRTAEQEIARADAAGAVMLRLGGPGYPPLLAEIPDPPPLLWALGDPALASTRAVAVVGARNASTLGLRMARRLAGDLGARGHVIVSGLARGVDAAAHERALDTGTVAVLAGGLDKVYPAENRGLAEKIAARGLLVSEAPMGLEPQGRHFPRRNRIVSGLSRGVVVIEAAARSGTLITARFALEQGREAMAVPGAPLDPRSEGCNALIRQGAALIRDADDVEEALAAPRTLFPAPPAMVEPSPEPETLAARPGAADLAARVFALLGAAPVDPDALARDLGAAPGPLASALAELELSGRIERRPGGLVARAVPGE